LCSRRFDGGLLCGGSTLRYAIRFMGEVLIAFIQNQLAINGTYEQ
jgi:hypothetical protein